MRHFFLLKSYLFTAILMFWLGSAGLANISLTAAANGGTADNAANSFLGGAWTNFGNIAIIDGSSGDFAQAINGPQNISPTSYKTLVMGDGGIKSLPSVTTAASLRLSSDNISSSKIDANASVLTLSSPNILDATASGYVNTNSGSDAGKRTVNNFVVSTLSSAVVTLGDSLPVSIRRYQALPLGLLTYLLLWRELLIMRLIPLLLILPASRSLGSAQLTHLSRYR
jgi:hypothetical protein